MALTPCAIFWDIQNIGIPKGQSAETIVSLVRTSLVNLYELREIYFYCVCDVTKLPASLGSQLTSQDVSIIQAYDYTKDSADIKILDLMRKFVENQGREGCCSIILLSGDGDYTATLNDLKKLFKVTIYLIRLKSSFAANLESVANYTFELCDGKLRPIKALGEPKCLVSFSRFPMTKSIRVVKLELSRKAQPYGCIDRSAIDHDGEVIIGFPSIELARRAVTALNAARYFGTFLRVQIVSDPITEISIKMKRAQFFAESKRKQLKSLRIRRRIHSNIKQSPFGRRWRNLSEDYIPLSSPNSRGYNSRLTSRSPFNPFRSFSNQKRRSIQSHKINTNKSKNDSISNNNDNVNDLQVTTETDTGSRWVSLYSETTNIRSPILIDLTANSPGLRILKDIRLQPSSLSSCSSNEIIPMVDLTDET